MKKLLIIFAILCLPFITAAQDLVVTEKGDSLNCKITKIKRDYTYFTFMYEDEIRSTLLPNNRIQAYEKNFYSEAELPTDLPKQKANYPKFRFHLSGGLSYLIAKIHPNTPAYLRDYLRGLKSGNYYGVDGSFFFTEYIGVGLKYSMFRTRKEMRDVTFTNYSTNTTEVGNIKDDIRVHYFGPAFYARFYTSNKKVAFIGCVSLGYLDYTNNATFLYDIKMTGNNIGVFYDIGVDFMIDKNLAAGIGISYGIGTISRMRVSQNSTVSSIKLSTENSQNVSRIDLGVGLKWYL